MTFKWILTPRQCCDLEMLAVGGFEPLTGFLTQPDYETVLSDLHLINGQIWPMPITLDVDEAFANNLTIGCRVGLYNTDNTLLAYMTVADKWQPNKLVEAQQVFGTQDVKHPGVSYLLDKANSWYIGGPIDLVQLPKYFDFPELRHSPTEVKEFFSQLGFNRVIGFQTRNPIHRAHMELTLNAAKQIDGHILIHPVVGLTKPGDIDYFTRVRCYQKIMKYYPEGSASLSLLPLAMRMGGPREAVWHALIRKNYGCTHFIIGRDHAGPGNNSQGKPFYDPYAAQQLAYKYQDEMEIEIVPFQEMIYVKERKKYVPIDQAKPNETVLTISGTQLRDKLLYEKPIPEWFSFPEIISELKNSYPSRPKQGLTLFFTGLSGAGKTTLAHALLAKLMSFGKRNISILDGDVMRRILANELGFSKEDRHLNITRIGYVASEITKAGGVAICAAIAPYRQAREQNRQLISQYGNYIEIYLSTSLQTCEKRDVKGLYIKARQGEIKSFTGIDDPYEVPIYPEIALDTSNLSIDESVKHIILFLQKENYLTNCEPVITEDKAQIAEIA
ncbi:bifunctional sulfate adenylyltransferase/adenylylsulfate kinase [Legionella drozanskii]|uniref:Adenylyl-sulfate kinase n=1 Tax=Legionella drozanskii LLAP-1 TaxID=1212489 RepID=A0A0W0SNF4_9GAMM|nr:bifunctional sulfate adenylyltransferase/adenylylsulfate kinase [Legionella drozanskii]KTC84785.1 putative bifunctional SAT/APS kinase [Legionella drozanskii LLAP-1]